MMKIFITQEINIIKSYKEKANTLSIELINYFLKYRPDILLIPVPNNIEKSNQMFDSLKPEGLILSGGNNINEFKERDETEKKMVQNFLIKKKPILGICRGIQFLNIFFGGKVQLNTNNKFGRNHSNSKHLVDIKGLDRKNQQIKVNSFHDYGILIKETAKNFKIFATCDEKIVEGFYDLEKKIYAIQWHPERKNSSPDFDIKLISKVFKNEKK